jgi:hypothetical protein
MAALVLRKPLTLVGVERVQLSSAGAEDCNRQPLFQKLAQRAAR